MRWCWLRLVVGVGVLGGMVLAPTAAHASWSADDIAVSITAGTSGGASGSNWIDEAGAETAAPDHGDIWANGTLQGPNPVPGFFTSASIDREISADFSRRYVKGNVNDPTLTVTESVGLDASAVSLSDADHMGDSKAEADCSLGTVSSPSVDAWHANDSPTLGPGSPYSGSDNVPISATTTLTVSLHCEGSCFYFYPPGHYWSGSFGAAGSVDFSP